MTVVPPSTTRRGRALVAVLAVLTLALAGCSLPQQRGESSGRAPVAPSATTKAPPTDPAQQPQFAAFYTQKLTWRDCGQGFECTSVTVPVATPGWR